MTNQSDQTTAPSIHRGLRMKRNGWRPIRTAGDGPILAIADWGIVEMTRTVHEDKPCWEDTYSGTQWLPEWWRPVPKLPEAIQKAKV